MAAGIHGEMVNNERMDVPPHAPLQIGQMNLDCLSSLCELILCQGVIGEILFLERAQLTARRPGPGMPRSPANGMSGWLA